MSTRFSSEGSWL